MKKYKKTIEKLCLVVVAAIILLQTGLSVSLLSSSNGNTYQWEQLTIVIDAGHGGIDSGVVGASGVEEATLNLRYAKELQQLLTDRGINVVMTRTTEGGLYGLPTSGFKMRDMTKRAEIISSSQADMVISIHMNYFSDSRRSGAQVFFQEGDNDSCSLASSVQSVLNNASGNKHSSLSGDYYICRCSSCPSIIVECGFLSNAAEEQMLLEDSYCHELCYNIMCGILLHLYSK